MSRSMIGRMAFAGIASAAVVIGGIATAAPAMAAPGDAAPGTMAITSPCGYSVAGFQTSIYNHCAGNNVRIEIDYNMGGNETRCVGPGETFLFPRWGGISIPVNAWYIGGC